jgi:hypothetical protein
MPSRRFARLALVAGLLVAGSLAVAATGLAGRGERTIRVVDACDPASFDAVLGAGACVGDGKVTFGDFIARLERTQQHPHWRFLPEHTSVPAGTSLVARNEGGEAHTFTEVASFGGGFVADLNALSGAPTPAPECALTLPGGMLIPAPSALGTFVPAGGSLSTPGLAPGTHRFLCCIHPWMKTEVTARSTGRG